MRKIVLLFTCFSFFFSCSLNYGKMESTEESLPELSFSDAQYSRYRGNQIKIKMQAEKIEQYKSQNTAFARAAQFQTWNDNNEPEVRGSCGLIAVDQRKNLYDLFTKISIFVYSQNIEFVAETLRWNGKTEQLTSDRNTAVSVQRDNLTVSGKGFSASGVTHRFVFTENAHGAIIDKEQDTTGIK